MATKKLSKPPNQVQLPGGVTLKGVPFRILTYDDAGAPLTFEMLPRGDTSNERVWTLYADEEAIRKPGQQR